MHKLVLISILIGLSSISGCARLDPAVRKSNAKEFAVISGFSIEHLDTQRFKIWSAYKGLNEQAERVVVYIEGDGLAYKRRHLPSKDPTPIDYYTLKLAQRDPASSVIYLARPCQYLSKQQLEACDKKYWTSHRYSEEVISTYQQILDQLRQRFTAVQFVLVGYSGGGNIAAHLAARRSDVIRLVTIAANLDLDAWTEFHALPPMKYSLNPAHAEELKSIKQIHFAGAKDTIVPPSVQQEFLQKIGNPEHAELNIRSEFDHHCCWLEEWRGVERLFNNEL